MKKQTQSNKEEKENATLHHNKFMIRNSNGFNYKFVIIQSSDFSNSHLSSPRFKRKIEVEHGSDK